jgi:protein-tyrosine kinase
MSLIERAIAKLAAANPQPLPTATPKDEPKLPPAKSVRPTVRLVPKPPVPTSTFSAPDDDEVLTRQIERVESVEEAETLIDDRPHEYLASRNSAKRVAIASDVLRAQGFITLERARTRVAHQFRVIKRVLIDNALQRSGEKLKHTRRIMITSALPGEGKTYCSINLAITLAAERNLRVLLVDADFARPGVMNALGLQAGPGLTDWLRGDEESPAELILPTNIRGLSLMPSGSTLRNTTELLSSSRCARRLRQLEAMLRNYIVLFDTSPLLPTIESLALSRHMGQVVLVVEADKTPRQAVGEACAMLSDHPSVALLLNKQKFKDGSENYGYGKYKRESD